MSASLVGSEMCIRDSAGAVAPRRGAQQSAGSCRNLQETARSGVLQFSLLLHFCCSAFAIGSQSVPQGCWLR
eukprot:8677871-Alexandrium_andersonii.AAC.1